VTFDFNLFCVKTLFDRNQSQAVLNGLSGMIVLSRSRLARVNSNAYTMVEVMVSVFVLAIMIISLYGGFSAGFAVVQLSRENLRATQILMQKTETIRLLTWNQVLNTNVYMKPAFSSWYDPTGTNTQSAGPFYKGFISASVPSNVPGAYQDKMRQVTVTVFWTNYPHKPMTNVVVRSREMQTLVARYGMQNYMFQ
jgi:Tfp pilus assembly protein PilV